MSLLLSMPFHVTRNHNWAHINYYIYTLNIVPSRLISIVKYSIHITSGDN